MKFKFKVGEKIKEVWPIYKKHALLFIALMVVTMIFQYSDDNLFVAFIFWLIGLLISYIWISSTLNLVKNKSFKPFSKDSLPSIMQFWNFIKTTIVSSLCVFAGLILFVVPGLYFIGRLIFAIYLSVDKNQGAMKSISESWEMTKGYGWYLFWKSFLVGLFILLGLLAIFFGIFITYPISLVVLTMLYLDFSKFKLENKQVGVSETVSMN